MITTSESNQESKRNMKEVRKVVSAESLRAHARDRVQRLSKFVSRGTNLENSCQLFSAQRSETVPH